MSTCNEREYIKEEAHPSRVCFFDGGIMTDCGGYAVPAKPKGGIRGEIKGWSFASRRRLREFLLMNQPPAGWLTYGASFTIPGGKVSGEETKRLWEHFSHNYVARNGWCMVWRMEIQKRGQYHFHSVISGPDRETELKKIETHKELVQYVCERQFAAHTIREAWLKALAVLGDCCGEMQTNKLFGKTEESINGQRVFTAKEIGNGKSAVAVSERRFWPGAEKYSVDVQEEGSSPAWLRYLQDHASKCKQGQLANFGRQWGIVGRKHYRKSDCLTTGMSDKNVKKVLRFMRRLFLKVIPDRRDPRGYRFGKGFNRGARGRNVWFSEASKKIAVMRFVGSLDIQPQSSH